MSNTIVVYRTGQAPLRVRGEVIAKQDSSWNNASFHYSGSVGRQQSVQVIRTASGKYVVAILNETQWQGEHDTHYAEVLPSLTQVIECLKEHIPPWMLERFIEDFGPEAVAEEIE